jgi:pfkB family carbohydrate kinase
MERVSERGPTLLVLGHVTRDLFGSESRTGGAAAYAAQAAALLGIDTALVTVAPSDAPELAPLRGVAHLRVCTVASERITTFGHSYAGSRRDLSILELARPLEWDDIPSAWRRPELVYAGPVAGECGADLIERFGPTFVIACLQGWLREPALGRVRPRRLESECRVPPQLAAAALSAVDHPSSPAIARALAERGIPTAVTRGRRGARISWPGRQCRVPAAPAQAFDSTGAGDVFALVFGLSLWRGHTPEAAAERAALAGARVVEGPGLGRFAELARRARVELGF